MPRLMGGEWYSFLQLVTIAGLICVIALGITDLREGRLPNVLVAALAALGGANLFISEAAPSLIDVPIGLVVGPAILLAIRVLFQRLRETPGLGLGDVKFAGAAALWVGASGLPLLFFVASIATGLPDPMMLPFGRDCGNWPQSDADLATGVCTSF